MYYTVATVYSLSISIGIPSAVTNVLLIILEPAGYSGSKVNLAPERQYHLFAYSGYEEIEFSTNQ